MLLKSCGRGLLAVFAAALGSTGGAVGAALLGAVGGLFLGAAGGMVGSVGAAVGRVVRLILCHEGLLLSQVKKRSAVFLPHW